MLRLQQILAWNGGGNNNITEITSQGGYTIRIDDEVEEPYTATSLESLGRFYNELK
jgi:hypothetical protein